MALLFAALVVSVACAPLPEESSAIAPSVASSTVVLVGVELSGPIGALVGDRVRGGFSAAAVADGAPAQLILISTGSGVLRLPLESDGHANGLGEFECVQWSDRLEGWGPEGEPLWNNLSPVRRSESGQPEIPEPPHDSEAEFHFVPEPYRPVAVAAADGRVIIAWREWVVDDYWLSGDFFVSLSDAASNTVRARSARFAKSGVSFRLHSLADITGDGESEVALVGRLEGIDQLVVLDGRTLEQLWSTVHAAPFDWRWSGCESTVMGEARDRVVMLLSHQGFGPRRVDVRMTGASPILSEQRLSQLSQTFDVHTVVAFDGDSVLASFSDHRSPIGANARDCLWAVIPDVARPEGQMATVQPVLFSACSAGWPRAWPIPDWDGDGRSEVLATDGIGGLLLFPSTRLSAPLHVASPDGWEVGGRSTSVVEHAGRQLVVTSAKRLSDSTSWTCVMELRPRTAAPGPVGR